MNNCNRVTITGADNNTDIAALVAISKDYPFVEWGILVSQRQQDTMRFPCGSWIDLFSRAAKTHDFWVSTHVCGGWVRELLRGELNWEELPACLDVSMRVQINTHAEDHVSRLPMLAVLEDLTAKTFIFQFDGVNDHLSLAAKGAGIRVAALFDESHGAGVLPKSWPAQRSDMMCGYAGGLGPENVAEQLKIIDAMCERPYWIDMEGRVRTNGKLDLAKVIAVLEAAKPYIRS